MINYHYYNDKRSANFESGKDRNIANIRFLTHFHHPAHLQWKPVLPIFVTQRKSREIAQLANFGSKNDF